MIRAPARRAPEACDGAASRASCRPRPAAAAVAAGARRGCDPVRPAVPGDVREQQQGEGESHGAESITARARRSLPRRRSGAGPPSTSSSRAPSPSTPRAQALAAPARPAAPQRAGPRARRRPATRPRRPRARARRTRPSAFVSSAMSDGSEFVARAARGRASRGPRRPRPRPRVARARTRGRRTLTPMPTTTYAGPAASPRRSIRMPPSLPSSAHDVVRPLERESARRRAGRARAARRRPRRATARQASPAHRDSSS